MDVSKQRGGLARAKSLSAARRSEIAKKAAEIRWGKPAIKMACLYVLGIEGGPLKVGWAADALKRVKAIQVGNHLPLVLMHSVAVPWCEAIQIESRAHRLLDEYAISGEWFDVTASVALQAIMDAISGKGADIPESGSVNKSVRMSALNWAFVAERAKKREISPNAWIGRMVSMVREGKLVEVKPK